MLALCPDLEAVIVKDMGGLLGVCIDTAQMYRECAARHKALVETHKPQSFWERLF